MSTPPAFYEPTRILARTAEAPAMLMGDQLFQRLLRHRIILLGQQVDEDIANRICAELVLLAAEDAKARHQHLHQFTRWLGVRGTGHLRRYAVRAE